VSEARQASPRLSYLTRRSHMSASRTSEQNAAFSQIRALAEPHRFRVRADAEGFPVIPGSYGRIEWADPEGKELAVYCHRPRLFHKLWAIPGVRRYQTGDQEIRAKFPPEALAQVAAVIRASRKPGFSSAMAKNVGSRTAFRGTSRPQNARPSARRYPNQAGGEMRLQEALK
jgi:hypothetical protein